MEPETTPYDYSTWASDHGWTDEQRATVDTLAKALRSSGWATAGFLVGSLARGTNDEFSDIDFHVVADPRTEWRGIVEKAMPTCYIGEFARKDEVGFPTGLFGLTRAGLKFDVFVHDPIEFDIKTLRDHLPVFDTACSRFASAKPGRPTPGYSQGEPFYPDHAVRTFYQAVEIWTQVMARKERYLAHRNSALRLEVSWIPLFLAENGIDVVSGKRRLTHVLSVEQVGLLDELIAVPTRSVDDMIDHTAWEMTEFRRRSLKLAERTDGEWPHLLAEIVEDKLNAYRPAIAKSPETPKA